MILTNEKVCLSEIICVEICLVCFSCLLFENGVLFKTYAIDLSVMLPTVGYRKYSTLCTARTAP